jgi:hypothetical protein
MNLHDQWITEARILFTDELTDLVRSTIQDYKTPSAMSSNGVGEVMARLSVLGERGFPCRWADYLPAVEQPASPEPDWAVLGPRLAAALKGAQQALRKALPHCPADDEHNGDSVFVGEWLDEVNEAVALLPTPALTTSQQIRVRACQIICNEHPEWGTWGVMEDRGEYFEIHGDRGGRVLFKSEADQSWSIVPA